MTPSTTTFRYQNKIVKPLHAQNKGNFINEVKKSVKTHGKEHHDTLISNKHYGTNTSEKRSGSKEKDVNIGYIRTTRKESDFNDPER